MPAGGPTQRAVLAMLALRAGQPVPLDSLSAGIWGEADEPAGAAAAMQVHVSRLRRLLQAGRHQPLQTVPGGYRLDPDELRIDSAAFEHDLAEGRRQLAAGEAAAAATLARALAHWRGPALMDLRDFPFAAHAAARYDELRVDAAEAAIAARLALGEQQAVVPELQELISANPYRERLYAQLMTALYRSGQQAAALDAYTSARSRLVLDLGVEPGPELAQLQQHILTQDPGLAVPAPGPAASPSTTPRSPPAAPARLPRVPELFGRDALLAELELLAKSERLVTLTGAGGSGKTSLALALAHRLSPTFPDGAAFVDLASVARPERVLPAVGAGMGVSPQTGSLATQLADVLADQRRLVVLDNLEHLLDAVPALAPLVEATSGLIVATSRAPLGLRAERLVPVPPLPVPEADNRELAAEPTVALFMHAAANAGVELDRDELPTVAAVCRALDGLPLAIELVAAQTGVEAVAELERGLAARLPAMSGRAHDVPARQRTMEAAIGWSLDRLGHEQRRAFVRLAVFAGGFDARAASAVLERDRGATLKLLGELLDASLLVRQEPAAGQARFRMLEPLRAVANDRADVEEANSAAQLHAAFMEDEVERLCPAATGIQRPEALAQLRLEHSDLMMAINHLSTTSPNASIDLLVQLHTYWMWTGGEIEAGHIAGRLLDAGELDEPRTCDALLCRAYGAKVLGATWDAVHDIDEAIAIAGSIADDGLLARVHLYEAVLANDAGDRARAAGAAEKAGVHAERADDLQFRAWAIRLMSLAIAGADWLYTAVNSMSRLGTERRPDMQVISAPRIDRNRFGMWAVQPTEREQPPESRAVLEAALEQAEAHAMGLVQIALLESIAYQHFDHSELALARQALEGARGIVRQFSAPAVLARFENNLGTLLARQGFAEEARSLLLSSLTSQDRSGRRLAALHPMGGLAEVEAAAGNWRNTLVLFAATKTIARSRGYLQLASFDETEAELIRSAEDHLGPEGAAEARAIGERMTYRDAVDFAFEINGIAGRVAAGLTPTA